MIEPDDLHFRFLLCFIAHLQLAPATGIELD